ncbi:MAG: hypothetical protein K0R30_3023 [Ornithinibacter sp.]|nr:hypothetical protein [Ornithinibacter sp.]
MPKPPMPAEVAEPFARPSPAVVAVLRPSGAASPTSTGSPGTTQGRRTGCETVRG